MFPLAYQPIAKNYNADILSRSFFIVYLCYLSSILVPILILLSIGYSWTEYNQIQLMPKIKYRHHQLLCTDFDSTTELLSSSFQNSETNLFNVVSVVSVGADQYKLNVYLKLYSANIQHCSLLMYLDCLLNNNLRTLLTVPINLNYNDKDISKLEQWGTLKIQVFWPLPQTNIIDQSQYNYYKFGQSFSMSDNLRRSVSNNVSAFAQVSAQTYIYNNNAVTTEYSGQFKILAGDYLENTSLLTNLRSFFPPFLYIFIFFWILFIKPSLKWMLRNKIYPIKVQHYKLKNI